MKTINKAEFVSILDAAQITSTQREKLHAAFEQRHPEAHADFLRSLQIEESEIEQIRQHARTCR
jgi:hypothetical protein